MFVMGCNGKKMEKREQWSNGLGRRRSGQDARSRRRMQNQGRGGAGMLMGSLVLGIVRGNSLMERGSGQSLSRRGDDGNCEGNGMNKKLADLANVRRKETRED
jgi:hypothetical protein